MMKKWSILLLVFSLLGLLPAKAQLFGTDLQKAFKAIDKSNYDKAIELFEVELKENSYNVAANYGMADVYFSRDFSGYNPEKAWEYIILAEENMESAGVKEIESLSKLDIDQSDLDILRDRIDNELFSMAAAKNNAEAINTFLTNYPQSRNAEDAKELLAFYNSDSAQSLESLNEMIRNNPNSAKAKQMARLRNMMAYQEAKAANNADALKKFILDYPDAEEIAEAKTMLAMMEFYDAKRLNTIAAYDSFLVRYPDAPEAADATMLRNQQAYILMLEDQKQRDSKIIKQQDESLTKSGQQLTIAAIGLILVLIVAGLLYRGYRLKQKSNEAITRQKEIIEVKNKEIVDSINYAKRIQDALLPGITELRQAFPEIFIFYKPRDIVSGDFYWYAQTETHLLLAAADCTGHGVPGSLVSMIGFNFLNELVNEQKLTDPGEILNQLHSKIAGTLNKEKSDEITAVRDGMDIALLSIDLKTKEIKFCGAVRPLYYFDQDGFKSIKSGMYSIGGIKSVNEELFASQTFKPAGKSMLYLFSDGYADQFGGPQGKKFKMKKLQELFDTIKGKSIAEQQKAVETAFHEWKGNLEQVDDVCVIGLRI
jgi:serine phosphatase RsbU (regulator of sigma subunit)